MKDYWRVFWMCEVGTGQQATQIHDSHMMMVMMVTMMIMILSTFYQFKKFPSTYEVRLVQHYYYYYYYYYYYAQCCRRVRFYNYKGAPGSCYSVKMSCLAGKMMKSKNLCSVCKRPFMTNRNPYILLGLCFGIYSRLPEVESHKAPPDL